MVLDGMNHEFAGQSLKINLFARLQGFRYPQVVISQAEESSPSYPGTTARLPDRDSFYAIWIAPQFHSADAIAPRWGFRYPRVLQGLGKQ
jgi:hypothetical protein